MATPLTRSLYRARATTARCLGLERHASNAYVLSRLRARHGVWATSLTSAAVQRADDVHPLQWWVLSESARRDAAASWKIKSGEILRANNRRSIPREPLEHMPPSSAPIPTATTALVTKFIVSDDLSNAPVSHNSIRRPAKLERANDRCPSLQHTTTSPRTSTSQAASSKPINVWELSDEVWQDPATVSVCNVSKPIIASCRGRGHTSSARWRVQ